MSTLTDWVTVPQDEKPFVHFETSLDNDKVVSGYVPVKSTLEVLEFLRQATELTTSQPRAVICHGAYGSGKSRLCTVLARLFRDGFEAAELQPVWTRLRDRGEGRQLDTLRQSMLPGGGPWKRWLVVPMYAQAGATISSALVRALVRALRAARLDDSILGKTIYHAAARRLDTLIQGGAVFAAKPGSPYATPDQLRRALEDDQDETALDIFSDFHRAATIGIEFKDYLQSASDSVLEAHEVYDAVAKRLREHGYDGIVVIWDEFGFAVEELLRDEQRGVRSLGQEVMRLQTFLENACGSQEVGKRILFLGFTHVSLSEYGSRANLGQTELNRLQTVVDRFRTPAINIRLSITETEGYHLLSGMLLRTPAGTEVLGKHPPRLLSLSERMPAFNPWSPFAPKDCLSDIVSACYPLHPAAATTLLILSDQIAQVSRTSFHFLHSTQDGGVAGELARRETPPFDEIGATELIRVHDMFEFFRQPIEERRRVLFEQYEDAESRYPNSSEFDRRVIRTVLILRVVATPDMAPTTSFLSFCLCDAARDEPAATALHEALERLTAAGCLSKNEATEVWGFGAGRGLASELDRLMEEERSLIPQTLSPSELLARYPDVQDELADYLGDTDLDPAGSGIVRRVGVRLLAGSATEKDLEPVNPALKDPDAVWRAGLIYLVAADTAEQIERWRGVIPTLTHQNLYIVLPAEPGSVSAEVRDLIAVHTLLRKQTAGTENHELIESKLTRLRNKLRKQFEASFGNPGLLAGTTVHRAGTPPTRIEVSTWRDLLPAVARNLASQYTSEIRVRCGTFNEWQAKLTTATIGEVVKAILTFNEQPLFALEPYLGFTETKQEAAVVDGVLVENQYLRQHPVSHHWELIEVSKEIASDALKEVFNHFTTGGSGEKEFSRLFERLIEPPFGIPNGTIPLLVALVLRGESERVALFERKGTQSSRVDEGDLSDAIVRMARVPARFATRYTRLTGPQRVVYKVIGPAVGQAFNERAATGDAFYQYCENVRSDLRKWAVSLTDAVLQSTGITDTQRKLLKTLRGAVPPHIVPLADALVEFVKEDATASEEMKNSETKEYPALIRHWQEFRIKLDRHVEGMKAPVRLRLRELVEAPAGTSGVDAASVAKALSFVEHAPIAGNPLQAVLDKVKDADGEADAIDLVTSAISGKSVQSLTDEDYGRAEGVLRMVPLIRPDPGRYVLLSPAGVRTPLPKVDCRPAEAELTKVLTQCLRDHGLSREQLISLTVSLIDGMQSDPPGGPPAATLFSEPAEDGVVAGPPATATQGEG